MRQAATKKYPLFHGGFLETGSPNVHSHNQPVWRAEEDEHNCAGGPLPPPPMFMNGPPPEHGKESFDGPERVPDGAERVLVNNKRLARAGDFLLGSGPANWIAPIAGNRVMVGENGIGMDDDGFDAAFCEEFCAYQEAFSAMSPAARLEAYKEMVRRLFARQGLPEPSFDLITSGTADGTYDKYSNTFGIRESYFKDGDPYDHKWALHGLQSTTRHEIRHGEQGMAALRYARTRQKRGDTRYDSHLGVVEPQVMDAVDARGELDESTKEGRWAVNFAPELTYEGKQVGWAQEKVNGQSMYASRYPYIPSGFDARLMDESGRGKPCKCQK
jgi:hypothetical protein